MQDPATKEFFAAADGGADAPWGGVSDDFLREESWEISDASGDFVERLLPAIVGLEIGIERMEGRKKAGQEVAALDQVGCLRGFRALGTQAGWAIARSIEEGMRGSTKTSVKEGEKSKAVVLAEEQKMGLERGTKVKGKFGWYYTAVR
jgi:hypothetical protein